MEFLRCLKNWKGVRGNHDEWLKKWLFKREEPEIWLSQGGFATVESYRKQQRIEFPDHAHFFKDMPMYLYVDDMVFVHGGFDPAYRPELQSNSVLMWDRSLIQRAHNAWLASKALNTDTPPIGSASKIFLGYTPTTIFHLTEPTHFGNVVAMDTGGGWEGKLSVMDIDTGEFWQSDNVQSLYPDARGRKYR